LATDLDGELDGERLCGHRLRTVVLLQELAHCLRVPPDRVRLPLVVGPARVRLHQHSDSCFKETVSRDSRDDFPSVAAPDPGSGIQCLFDPRIRDG
jgi:hypothetical protein